MLLKESLRIAGRALQGRSVDATHEMRAFPAANGTGTKGGAVFEDSHGRAHSIDEHLRYGLKDAWRVYSPLSFLAELHERKLLDPEGLELLKKLRGRRTISAPLDEVRNAVTPYKEEFGHLLTDPALSSLGKRVLRPTPAEIEKKIAQSIEGHNRTLNVLGELGHTITPKGSSVMEIGYISGGESIVGFERMGFQAAGLEYFYDGTLDGVMRYQEVQKVTGTSVRFEMGDITKKTLFQDEEFDLIFTAQVLEHIVNLPDAFREMHRILKPGGVMVHVYDPYFHPRGGHSFGILDFPWGHLRLDSSDFERYLKELRPYEAEHALPWCQTSLNRKNTIQVVQGALVDAGFLIRSWKQFRWDGAMGIHLTTDVIRECLERNPQVSLDDLMTSGVRVIAEKA